MTSCKFSTLYRKEARQAYRSLFWLLPLLALFLLLMRQGSVSFVVGTFACVMTMSLAAEMFYSEKEGSIRYMASLPVGFGQILGAKYAAFLTFVLPAQAGFLAWTSHFKPLDFDGALLASIGTTAVAHIAMFDSMSKVAGGVLRRHRESDVFGNVAGFTSVIILIAVAARAIVTYPAGAREMLYAMNIVSLLISLTFLTLAFRLAFSEKKGVPLIHGYPASEGAGTCSARQCRPNPLITLAAMEIKANTKIFTLILSMGFLLHLFHTALNGDFCKGSPLVFCSLAIAAMVIPVTPFHRHESGGTTGRVLTLPTPDRSIVLAYLLAAAVQIVVLTAVDCVYVMSLYPVFLTGGWAQIGDFTLWMMAAVSGAFTCSAITGMAVFLHRQRRMGNREAAVCMVSVGTLMFPVLAPDIVAGLTAEVPGRHAVLVFMTLFYLLGFAYMISRIQGRGVHKIETG